MACWDLNTNGICDPGTEDKNSDGTCDIYDCEFASQWNGLYNGTCPCDCSLDNTACHGQTLVCPMSNELFICSSTYGAFLASEYTLWGEQQLACPTGNDLTTHRGCGLTYGMASTKNTGMDMGMPFYHKATFTRVGISTGLTISGEYDIQIWGNNNSTVDDVSGMSLLCTLAANRTEGAFITSVTDCTIEANQFIAIGIENRSGSNIKQFTISTRYKDQFQYCAV